MGIFTGSNLKESKDLVLQVGSQMRPCLLNASHHHYFPSQHKRKLKSLIGNPNTYTEQTFATRWVSYWCSFTHLYLWSPSLSHTTFLISSFLLRLSVSYVLHVFKDCSHSSIYTVLCFVSYLSFSFVVDIFNNQSPFTWTPKLYPAHEKLAGLY